MSYPNSREQELLSEISILQQDISELRSYKSKIEAWLKTAPTAASD